MEFSLTDVDETTPYVMIYREGIEDCRDTRSEWRRVGLRLRFKQAVGTAAFLFATYNNSSIAAAALRANLNGRLSGSEALCAAVPRWRLYAWHTFRTRGIMPVDTPSSDGTRTFPVAPETQRPAIMSVNRRRCDRSAKQCAIVANLFHYR